MNYHSIGDLQDYFDSASKIVYEAFPKQIHGDYLTKEQRGACLSYIPHGANLSLKFAQFYRATHTIRGYGTENPLRMIMLIHLQQLG
jgi:hypothetical protein